MVGGWKEEGVEGGRIGKKRRDGRRVDGVREHGIVMTGRSDRDDGKTGFVWCPRRSLVSVAYSHRKCRSASS